MEKKKAIKIATATAIAASAFTAVAPTQSEAATSLTSQIKTAKATIKKPYDTYINATKTPASLTTVKNQIAAAKKAKASINAAIKKAKLTTKQKNAKYAEIKAYDQYITRAEGYVAALSIDVVGAKNQLATAIASGNDTDKLAKQNALKTKIAQFKTAVAKVYGKNTRSLLLSYYVTPAQKLVDSVVFDVKIESVSALNDTNQFLQINFSNQVKSLKTSDIEIKDAKKGDLYGVKAVTLSSDGKVATVELYTGVDKANVLQYLTDYTVTVNANGKKVSANFNRAAFLDQRVVSINDKDNEFSISNGITGTGTETIKVVDQPNFNFEALKGEKVRVWYNKDNELIKYEIANSTAKTDAIEVTKTNEIKILSTGVKYDTSTEVYNNTATEKKFAFYVDGKRVDVNGQIPAEYVNNATGKPAKFNYAKVGFDKSGKIEYVAAYTLKNFLVADRVEGNSIVGVQGVGTGGDFNADGATLIKDGKSISKDDVKKGDVVFFYNDGSGQGKKDRFAVVVSKTVTGTIDSVYDQSVTISGKTYDFKYDSSVQPRFQTDYAKAVYVNDSGKTDYIDSDAAKSLKAGGQVTAYFDLAGNLVYIAGANAQIVSNATTGILTDAIVGDKSFNKDTIQVDAILANGNETVKSVQLDNLDKIKIDGVEYKIDNTNPASDKYQAVLESDGADYQTLVLFAANQNPASYIAGNPATYATKVQLDTTEGQAVKLSLDNNNNISKLELYTVHDNGVASPKNDGTKLLQGSGILNVTAVTAVDTDPDNNAAVGNRLKAGDKYAVTSNGSKQLLDSTPVFDAKDGYGKGFDSKDINITTWGQYKGSDINYAKVYYNDNNEAVAVVILKSSTDTKKYEEALVTNVLRNTDGDVVSVEAYVNGKKQTLSVDKVSSNNLVKGSVAVFQFDDNNTTMVKDIYTTGSTNPEYTSRTGLTGLTVANDAVDVGNREVTINGTKYKFAADGVVFDGTDATDISVKSLTDLRGRTNVTAVLDEKDPNGAFVKYFIYKTTGTVVTPPAAVTATVTGNYTLSNLSDKVTATLTTGATYSDYQVQVLDGTTVTKVVGLTAATTQLDGAQLGLTANSGKEYTVNVVKKADGSVVATKKVLAAPGSDFTAPVAVSTLAFTDGDDTVGKVGGNITFTASTSTDVASTVVTFNGTTVTPVSDVYTLANGTAIGAGEIKVVVTDTAGNTSTSTYTVTDVKPASVVNDKAGLLAALSNNAVANIELASNITLDDELNITRTVNIDGKGHSLSHGMQIHANNVVIDNLTINPSLFYTDVVGDWYYGVMVDNATGVVIKNSTIIGVPAQDAVGISDTAGSTTGFTVENVSFSNLWTAVLTDSANTDISVTGSTFDSIKHGVYITDAPAVDQVISGNTFTNLVATGAGDQDAISLPTGSDATQFKAPANTFTGITTPADVRVR